MNMTPYIDKLKAEYNSRFPWLVRLLTEITPQDQQKGKGNGKTNITIFTQSAIGSPETFSLLPANQLDEKLREALRQPDIIYIHVEHIAFFANINVALVDALGDRFGVDPVFFHFHYGKLDKGDPADWAPLLPSEIDCLQLPFNDVGSHATATVRNIHGRPFGLMYACLNDGKTLLDSQHLPSLKQMSLELNNGANITSLNILCPILRREAKQWLKTTQSLMSRISEILKVSYRGTHAQTELVFRSLGICNSITNEMTQMRGNFEAFARRCREQNIDAPLLDALISDYQHLQTNSERMVEQWKMAANGIWTFAGIEEAHKGIVSAESVRRLTIVAMIFIPLNFATSFFGMNVRLLGTSEVNTWWFVAVAAVMTIFSLVVVQIMAMWQSARPQQSQNGQTSIVQQVKLLTGLIIQRFQNLFNRNKKSDAGQGGAANKLA